MAVLQIRRVAALVASTLVGLSGLWFGARDLVGYPGRLTVVGSLSIVMALVTLSLAGVSVAKKPPYRTWRTWSLFILTATVGYLIAMDGFTYMLYLRRPGGLPGGCYTLLELWAKVLHGSWIREAEQIAAVLLFFGSPLVLLVETRRPKSELAINGA